MGIKKKQNQKTRRKIMQTIKRHEKKKTNKKKDPSKAKRRDSRPPHKDNLEPRPPRTARPPPVPLHVSQRTSRAGEGEAGNTPGHAWRRRIVYNREPALSTISTGYASRQRLARNSPANARTTTIHMFLRIDYLHPSKCESRIST